jgi:RNA polymerase sigma-70 factor (ECF subfamily)
MASRVGDATGTPWREAAAAPDWDAVFRDQFPRVYNFLRYRVRNEAVAEDLTARTFEKAWLQRHSYRSDVAAFSTWLLRIARNAAIDHLRTAHEHLPLEKASEAPAEGTPEEDAEVQSNFARLAELIEQLPQREQELLALKYGAGATNRAMAGLVGLSETNVGTILHRAVQTLRSQW